MRADERSGPVTQPAADGLGFVLFLDLALLVEDLSRRGEPAGQPHTGGLHEPAQLTIRDRAHGLRPHPSGDRPGEMHDVPAPCGQQVERTLEPSGERQVHQAEHPDEDRQRQHPQQRRQPVVLEHRHDGRPLLVVPLGPPMTLGGAFAGRRRVPVTGARERRHQHVESREACAPAEVEILVPAVQSLVEQSDPLPRVARDQHRARRDAQHLDHAIELPLIDLARLQRRVRVTEPIRGTADLPEQPRFLPVDDLGPDDADVLHAHADRRLDETRHRIGIERGVVVQYQEVVGGSRRGDLERRAYRSGQTAVAVGDDDAPVAQCLPEQVR